MSARERGGYPIGTRRAAAMALAKRNAERARTAWMENLPREPRALVAVLREAGVDLVKLRKALP